MIHIKMPDNRNVYLNPKQISAIENILNSDNTWEVQIIMNNLEVYSLNMDNGELVDLFYKWTFSK